MDVQKILSSIVNGITNREVKSDKNVSSNKVISYGGFYQGEFRTVTGYKSPELVLNSIPALEEMYSNVDVIFPSAKDEPPTGEVPVDATCEWVMPD